MFQSPVQNGVSSRLGKFWGNRLNGLNCLNEFCVWAFLFFLPLKTKGHLSNFFLALGLLSTVLLLWGRGRRLYHSRRLWLTWAFFGLTVLSSLFYSEDILYSLQSVRQDILAGFLAFFFCLHAIDSPARLRRLWIALIVISVFYISGGAFPVIPQTFLGGKYPLFSRASSFCVDFAHFAALLSLLAPYLLLFPRAFRPRRVWMWGLGAVFLLFLLAVYNSGTRILWPALIIGFTAYLMFICKRKLLILAAGILLLAASGAALVMWPGAVDHGEEWDTFLEDPQATGGTAGDLLTVWSFSWDYLTEHPWQGIGYGRYNFERAFPEFMEGKNPLLGHTHNTFVDLAVQLGLQGLAVFIIFLAFIFKTIRPPFPPAPGDLPACFRLAVCLMFLIFMVRNSTDNLFVGSSAEFFWALTAAALASLRATAAFDQAGYKD
ncbi:MAG: O-antigen ligase family protein [Desulfarculales bacterium]|jgi:O-antigen ligase|nr:O-antigen ligase family protein [Desulfarculales bacterium]